jgi:hypothetical protein
VRRFRRTDLRFSLLGDSGLKLAWTFEVFWRIDAGSVGKARGKKGGTFNVGFLVLGTKKVPSCHKHYYPSFRPGLPGSVT